MANPFYLLNVTITGIKNIQNPVKLNFYKDTVTKNFDGDNYRIKAIYGENGTGKTALLTGVKILREIVLNNGYLLKNENILNTLMNVVINTISLQCEFSFKRGSTLIINNYSVTIKKENKEFKIENEILKYKLNASRNKEHIVYETKDGELTTLNCNFSLKRFIEDKTKNLLSSNTLTSILFDSKFVDWLKNHKEESIEQNIVSLTGILETIVFMNNLSVLLQNDDQHDIYKLKNQLNKLDSDELISHLDMISKLEEISRVSDHKIPVKQFDQYEKKVKKLCAFLKMFKSNLQNININRKIKEDYYICNLELEYERYSVDLEFESTGIKNLVELFDSFDDVAHGKVVFIDELDANINEVYLNVLIDYFMNYTDGQLCFTTHNSSPMNILKDNKESISFLSSNNVITTWTTKGNASPENAYRNGMIEDLPFNVYSTDFIGIFGDDDE